ncbi:unnamed protein product [Owenia fusiformis]|uniref:Alpha-galactosidase n=1 Tax=Owenia fusiformis TaxID=6347 RepID=A0A8J1THK6_OWEFU|nr:unnamed protein product [Owenia fusiformis]
MLRLISLICMLGASQALDNGLALTPPMGWLSWERFRCNTDCKNDPDNCISENLFKTMADHIVSEGYKDAGYEYVNIDDCWLSHERDAQGRLQADPDRFPSGIKALADYIHDKGLKFGIYEDIGTHTCGGYPGVEYYFQQDAQQFADWGVDFVKLDGCYIDSKEFDTAYPAFGHWMNKTGRHMVYSCSWPAYQSGHMTPDYPSIAKYCNLWRNYGDIQDSWDSVQDIITWFGKDAGNFSAVTGPGAWNDPDMLIIGDYGLSIDQQKAQMAMWAMMAAPLIMSTDLRNIRPESKAILQNKGVIAINQDPMGKMGKVVYTQSNVQLWSRPILPEGSVAFAYLYTGTGGTPSHIQDVVTNAGLTSSRGYNVTCAFTGKHIGYFKPTDKFDLHVDPTGVFLGIAKIF